MYVPFDQLPASARVWIYQASRPLTDAEEARIQPLLSRFAEEWTSHGRTLQASVALLHRQFLAIGLDEAVADASGCSIDASVRFVRELETLLGVSLLEKSQLAFLVDEQVHLLDRLQLKAAIEAGRLTSTTPYFDATLSLKDALETGFPAPAGTTWLARYFG